MYDLDLYNERKSNLDMPPGRTYATFYLLPIAIFALAIQSCHYLSNIRSLNVYYDLDL